MIHLRDIPEWLSLMFSWGGPALQQDASEFLLYVCQCPSFGIETVELPWQARANEGGAVQITDSGQSAPLGLIPPCDLHQDDVCVFSIQQLVTCWHSQTQVHAAIEAPSAIILQVGRFHFDEGRSHAVKRKYRVSLERHVMFPVFMQGLSCRYEVYQLSAVVLHFADAPTRGHYRSLTIADDSRFSISDDHTSLRTVDSFDSFLSDVYLIILRKCSGSPARPCYWALVPRAFSPELVSLLEDVHHAQNFRALGLSTVAIAELRTLQRGK